MALARPLWAAALLLLLAGLAQGEVVIEQAARKIDISSSTAREQERLVLRNDGAEAKASVVLCERSSLLDQAALLEVAPEGGSAKLPWTPAAALSGSPADVSCREYKLPAPLAAGGKTTLLSVAVYTHVLRPEPAEVSQRDVQRVVFRGGARLMSPYKVESQATEIHLGRVSEAPTFTNVQPVKRSTDTLTYGPYTDTPPFTSEPITVHYENNQPFAHVTDLEREVEVSHWGNVYFEERYSLRHAGAKVVGEWSRYDIMTRPQEFARASIPALAAVLPAGARSLYYRDAIGNISSSETRHEAERVTVNLQPRYPLFGGWSTKFLFGWSLPLSKAVAKDSRTGRMVLTTQVAPSILDLVVDELTLKVVLPEGASNPVATTELPLSAGPTLETKHTYLDVMGRPVVVLRARNLVSDMTTPVKVEYTYSSLGLLQKPLLLVGAFGLLFVAAIVLNRGGASLVASPSAQAVVKAHAS
ncbi:hypothetical protein ABPG77_009352 [Micractinium sp. CCAP 211/92]